MADLVQTSNFVNQAEGFKRALVEDQKRQAEAKRAEDLRAEQEKQYKDFAANLGQYKDQSYGIAASNERKRLAEEMAGVKKSYNSRGLLYSGKKQAADASAQANSGANLAQIKQGINDSFDTQAEQMRSGAISTGIGIQQNQQAIADLAYQQALASMAQRRGLTSSLMQAGGMATGMYLAGA